MISYVKPEAHQGESGVEQGLPGENAQKEESRGRYTDKSVALENPPPIIQVASSIKSLSKGISRSAHSSQETS